MKGAFARRRSELCDAESNQPWRYCFLRAVVPYKRFREGSTQLSRVLFVYIVMHERIPSPGKVSDWLILQMCRTSRTNLIFGDYRSGFEGYAGFQARNYANWRNLHTTRTI